MRIENGFVCATVMVARRLVDYSPFEPIKIHSVWLLFAFLRRFGERRKIAVLRYDRPEGASAS
jgi:hypothetical protein